MIWELWVNRGGRYLALVSGNREILLPAVKGRECGGKGSGPEHHFPIKETWTFGSHILETPSFAQEIKRCSGAMETTEQM